MASFDAHSSLLLRTSILKPTDLHRSFASSASFQSYFNRHSKSQIKPSILTAALADSPFSSSQLHRECGFSVKKKQSLSQTLAVKQLTGSVISGEGLRFAIVVARFNEIITKPLLEGALDTFKKYNIKEEDIDVVWVPGCFEIGLVAEKLGKSKKYQAVLCIGAVVRGDTSHYDAVANSAASGVLNAGLNSGVPCIFGVLTCDTMGQAIDRAGGKAGNKGAEAALTAIEMASLFAHHLKF